MASDALSGREGNGPRDPAQEPLAGAPACLGGGVADPPWHDLTRLFTSERARLGDAVRRRIGDSEEAADLVQDAFARIVEASSRAALRTPAAYLQRIVRNLLRDRARCADYRYVARDIPLSDALSPVAPPQQEWGIEADDLLTGYTAALATLTPRTREVFLLHRVEELRYREIAHQLGISVATVEYHMARALAHFDKALNR